MLSGLLNSPRAIQVNINIMRAFVRMRQYLLTHAPKQELEELRKRIEYLEEDISSDRENYEQQFRRTVFRLCPPQRYHSEQNGPIGTSGGERLPKRK